MVEMAYQELGPLLAHPVIHMPLGELPDGSQPLSSCGKMDISRCPKAGCYGTAAGRPGPCAYRSGERPWRSPGTSPGAPGKTARASPS